MTNPLVMSETERQAFLAEVHVGVLSIDGGDGAAPLQSPVWYEYEPGGDVVVNIGAGSRKAELLAAAGRASLCVQREDLPYRFVVVAGPAVLAPADDATRRRIAARYLPGDLVEGYLAGAGDASESVSVRLTPTSWRSNDFGRYAG
jgi:PPOX class probable F420-dependent enzyme